MEVTHSDGSLQAGTYSVRTSGGVLYSPLSSLNPDHIDRIEIINGDAAAGLFGDRAEGGVIQIFTIEPEASEPEEPSANDAPPAGNGSSTNNTRQVKPIELAFYVRLGTPAFVLTTNELSLVP